MGVCCTRSATETVEVVRGPAPEARHRGKGAAGASGSSKTAEPVRAVASDGSNEGGALEELPPFFAEILRELELHKTKLGGLKHFEGRPRIDRKVTRKELAADHSDYEYIYLTVMGIGRLHLRNEEIVRKNNGQPFNKNPGVQLLERETGLTMHAERPGANGVLRSAPASLIQAFQLSKGDPGGPLKFFKNAFDRTADPCLEGRLGRILEYLESRRRSTDPASADAPPWEDVTLSSLPDGSSPLDIVGEHLRVFVAERTWHWAKQRGLSYDAAKEARQLEPNREDFANLFNAQTFEAAMVARGVACEACPRQWESSTKSGEWIPYEPDLSLRIDKAHEQKQPSISVRMGPKSWTYIIDFGKMVQRNAKTGQERPLRCVSAADGGAQRPGCLSRDALREAIRYFVELATLPPGPEGQGVISAGGCGASSVGSLSPGSTRAAATEAGSPLADESPLSAESSPAHSEPHRVEAPATAGGDPLAGPAVGTIISLGTGVPVQR